MSFVSLSDQINPSRAEHSLTLQEAYLAIAVTMMRCDERVALTIHKAH